MVAGPPFRIRWWPRPGLDPRRWYPRFESHSSHDVCADRTGLQVRSDKARFRRVVRPGDQLVLQLEMIRQKGKVTKMNGKAYVDDQLATEAELMASFA